MLSVTVTGDVVVAKSVGVPVIVRVVVEVVVGADVGKVNVVVVVMVVGVVVTYPYVTFGLILEFISMDEYSLCS